MWLWLIAIPVWAKMRPFVVVANKHSLLKTTNHRSIRTVFTHQEAPSRETIRGVENWTDLLLFTLPPFLLLPGLSEGQTQSYTNPTPHPRTHTHSDASNECDTTCFILSTQSRLEAEGRGVGKYISDGKYNHSRNEDVWDS